MDEMQAVDEVRDLKTIDIVLPVYNEQEGIFTFNEALFASIKPLRDRYRFHIVYVLDRSQDDTFQALRQIAANYPHVTVLHLSRRFGHQMSLVAGIDRSSGDAVIMMDCDLQHPPSLIPVLLEKFEQGYDIVHTVRQYNRRAGAIKRVTSQLFYYAQNALSPVELTRGAADFRLISRKVAVVFQESIREQNQFLRGLFHWVGFRNTTVTYISQARIAGETKYHAKRLLMFAIAGILSFSKIPLRAAGLFGIAFSMLGLMYGALVVYRYLVDGRIPPGYTTLIVAILVVGGLQLTVLGIIGEYIGSIFDEVKHRPLYVVDEVIQGDEA